MNNYLIEIGTEELPADYIDRAIADFEDRFVKLLTEHELEYKDIKSFSTPRRLTLLVEGLDEYQDAEEVKQRGPSVEIGLDGEEPTPALEGFMRSQGITIEDVIEEDGYLYGVSTTPPKHISEIIKSEMPSLIKSIYFPRRMMWDDSDLQFARPIRWILSLYGDTVLDFELGNIDVSNMTRGHRVLGSQNISINDPLEYQSILEDNYVIVDSDDRKNYIETEIEKIASLKGGEIKATEDLINELKNIVEYPTAIVGDIREDFLSLPTIVITTAIEEHLRFVPIYKEDNVLLPYFISIVNGIAEHEDIIKQGNEKVLGARLQDAKFFYEDDLNSTLEELVDDLDGIIYQESLGTVKDRVDRIVNLSEKIADQLYIADQAKKDLNRAALLSKSDLLTGMVNEFTELQGFIGEIYAINQEEPTLVSTAIREQYLPRFAGDDLPETTVGSILSMADKLDAICGMFAVDIIPTGSQDPFGLRRAAIGIVSIILDNKWNISIKESIKYALYAYVEENSLVFDYNEVSEEIYKFFLSRIKVALEDRGIRYDIIDGLLATNDGDIYNIFKKADILDQWFETDRSDILEATRRVHNIAAKHSESTEYNVDIFNEYEKNLHQEFEKFVTEIETIGIDKNYDQVLDLIETIVDPINSYFDNVMVFDEDEEIKSNRLGFMGYIDSILGSIFDFSRIAA